MEIHRCHYYTFFFVVQVRVQYIFECPTLYACVKEDSIIYRSNNQKRKIEGRSGKEMAIFFCKMFIQVAYLGQWLANSVIGRL